jgi:hypothetical protein
MSTIALMRIVHTDAQIRKLPGFVVNRFVYFVPVEAGPRKCCRARYQDVITTRCWQLTRRARIDNRAGFSDGAIVFARISG